ncbi:beta-lactamase family protein [bacterium]|nr:beta-lactamase family protein [bacterium]
MIQNASLGQHRKIVAMFLLGCFVCSSLLGQSDSTSFETDLEAHIQRVMKENWIPGAAVVVVQGDKTMFLKGYGMADIDANRQVTQDTLFYIASSTKSFTGLAAAICAHQGKLDLNKTLDHCLSDAKFHQDIDPATITLRDLLTHTHGISNDGPVSFRSAFSGQHTPELLKDLLRLHGVDENGKEFEYGNIGYNLAGLAMQNELGIHWKDLLNQEIFAPLKMESTTGRVSQADANQLAMPYQIHPDGFSRLHYGKADENMHAAGGLVTTAADLANWLKININRGELNGEQLIPEEVFELAHAPLAKQERDMMKFSRDGYGLGWNTGEYDGDRFTHHFGGFNGFHCQISFMPEKKIGVAILVNSGSGFMFADVVSRYAYDHLRDVAELDQRFSDQELKDMSAQAKKRRENIGADLERRAARPQALLKPLEAYTGTFENEQFGQVVLSVVEGKLEAVMGPLWSAVETYDAEKNLLRVELLGNGQVVDVQFDGKEQAQRILVYGDTFTRVE